VDWSDVAPVAKACGPDNYPSTKEQNFKSAERDKRSIYDISFHVDYWTTKNRNEAMPSDRIHELVIYETRAHCLC
jgi:hypothetical protein